MVTTISLCKLTVFGSLYFMEIQLLVKSCKSENIKQFIDKLEACNSLIEEFDEALWNSVIESVKIKIEQDIIFVFKNKVV